MENMGWFVTAIIFLQVVCHVLNTLIREYFNRIDSVRDLLRQRDRLEAQADQDTPKGGKD